MIRTLLTLGAVVAFTGTAAAEGCGWGYSHTASVAEAPAETVVLPQSTPTEVATMSEGEPLLLQDTVESVSTSDAS